MTKDRAKAYADCGVNIKAGNALVSTFKNLAASTKNSGVLTDIGGFGGLYRPNLEDMAEPLLVASTDGVGTKLKLASIFNRHDTIGIDLVAMSVNDILVQGAAPLFFLDYFACSKLDPDICTTVVSGISKGCRLANCALLGGETAEMPEMYSDGEYDLAGFCVGIVDKQRLIDGSEIHVGDAVIGIASSGIHSNGYSLVRKIFANSGLKADDDFPLENGKKVADVLLEPTIIYIETVKPLLRDLNIKGMVHITGGGFYDNIPRVLPAQAKAVINCKLWEMQPVFHWLKKQAGLTWPEMFQIFNCGIGFIIILPEEQVEEAINRIKAFNINAWKIGNIELRNKGDGENQEEQVELKFFPEDK